MTHISGFNVRNLCFLPEAVDDYSVRDLKKIDHSPWRRHDERCTKSEARSFGPLKIPIASVSRNRPAN